MKFAITWFYVTKFTCLYTYYEAHTFMLCSSPLIIVTFDVFIAVFFVMHVNYMKFAITLFYVAKLTCLYIYTYEP